jgi:hypothetical protein
MWGGKIKLWSVFNCISGILILYKQPKFFVETERNNDIKTIWRNAAYEILYNIGGSIRHAILKLHCRERENR